MGNKTLKEIADELGIDKQKVYRFVKKNHIKSKTRKRTLRSLGGVLFCCRDSTGVEGV